MEAQKFHRGVVCEPDQILIGLDLPASLSSVWTNVVVSKKNGLVSEKSTLSLDNSVVENIPPKNRFWIYAYKK